MSTATANRRANRRVHLDLLDPGDRVLVRGQWGHYRSHRTETTPDGDTVYTVVTDTASARSTNPNVITRK